MFLGEGVSRGRRILKRSEEAGEWIEAESVTREERTREEKRRSEEEKKGEE